ncbi:ATP-binding cassette domain-containing protein [Kineococcus gypseus]|uniref:ATP-binding cassette domain-containing protein n=1 Tax=Kineococcus gypseus TaxID=1637102 RepID=UPI003D7D8776
MAEAVRPAPAAPAALRVRGLVVTPPGAAAPVLRDVDLDVPAGQRVLLAGPSGSGKSTLLRALAGVLEEAPGGEPVAAGEVLVGGAAARPGAAGLLLQDPLDAVVAATAGRDTAFGPENLALAREEVWERVARAHAAARFTAGREREVATLSGGERQRLALAGVLALLPGVLLLDEPTSMLDAPTAAAVRAAVLGAAAGRTLVVVDHDLAGWAPHVDRVVLLGRDGRLAADGPPARVLTAGAGQGELWLPGAPAPRPADVPAGLLTPRLPAGGPLAGDALTGRGLGLVRRRRGLRPSAPAAVLTGVDVDVPAGRTTPLVGTSGSGKSSLLAVLAGLVRPSAGELRAARALAAGLPPQPWRWRSRELAARSAWVPQTPEHAFVRTTARAEAAASAAALGLPTVTADALLELLGLSHRAEVDPFRLSGGEQRRLALAGALAAGPAVLLADEPTVGQDRATWSVVAGLLLAAARDGAAVVAASHDGHLVRALDPAGDAAVHLRAGRRATGPVGPVGPVGPLGPVARRAS